MQGESATALAQARAVLDAVQGDPRAALAEADALLAGPARGEPAAEAVAHQAAALALRELDDLAAGLRRARRAVRVADGAGRERIAAQARLSLALLLANAGRTTAALDAIDQALPYLHAADAGRARMQRGVVLHFAGRLAEAERDYTAAIGTLAKHADVLAQARALNNRGYLRAHRGAGPDAQRDLEKAGRLFDTLDLPVAAADVRWNAAVVAAQRGAIPEALAALATVEADFRSLGVPRPAVVLDHVDVLLSVPLVDEARSLATQAVDMLTQRGLASDAAEARLAAARASLEGGDASAAEQDARAARAAFRHQGRRPWEVAAWQVQLRAQVLQGAQDVRLARELLEAADELAAMGWRTRALQARVDAADLLHVRGELRATPQWQAAALARRGGTAATRALGWYAHGRLLQTTGSPAAAQQAWRRGLDELFAHRASLAATELRAASAARSRLLAQAGLREALGQGHPSRVLTWSERWRAGALLMRSPAPTSDPELGQALTALRVVSAELAEASLDGHPAAVLRQQQAQLERRVRDLTRQRDSPGAAQRPERTPTVHALSESLGGTALVEFVDLDGERWAVVVAAGRATLHRLGEAQRTTNPLAQLGFALRRLSGAVGPTAGQHAARVAADAAAAELDAALLGPLRRRIGDRPVLVAPTGALHAVPWSLLPTVRGRDLAVTPSASVWLHTVRQPARRCAGMVAAAGPQLPGARDEAVAVAHDASAARLLVDGDATTRSVLAALEGAQVAHVAAHGTVRADNPMFSSLLLADGPLTIYDIETLTSPPETVVLSACDAGRSSVRPGDEVMGLAAAFLGLGSTTLVATVLPIPDGAAVGLMRQMHRLIRSGVPVAEALRQAQQQCSEDGPEAFAAAAAFVCFGGQLAGY